MAPATTRWLAQRPTHWPLVKLPVDPWAAIWLKSTTRKSTRGCRASSPTSTTILLPPCFSSPRIPPRKAAGSTPTLANLSLSLTGGLASAGITITTVWPFTVSTTSGEWRTWSVAPTLATCCVRWRSRKIAHAGISPSFLKVLIVYCVTHWEIIK